MQQELIKRVFRSAFAFSPCSDQEPFDWYQRYSALRNILSQHISKEAKILMAGCGNSRLSEEMHDDG